MPPILTRETGKLRRMAWSERLRETLETEEGKQRFVQQFPTYLLVQFIVQKCFTDFLRWRMR